MDRKDKTKCHKTLKREKAVAAIGVAAIKGVAAVPAVPAVVLKLASAKCPKGYQVDRKDKTKCNRTKKLRSPSPDAADLAGPVAPEYNALRQKPKSGNVPLEIREAKGFPEGTPFIIVPFREQIEQKRGQQLDTFVRSMRARGWPILIVDQAEGKRFNRGALLNVGVKYAEKMGAKYVVLHDVDMLPADSIVPYYKAFPKHPIHIGGIYAEKYSNELFLGQVLSISLRDYKRINGFPNDYWGWGGEDDAMRIRLDRLEIPVYKPTVHTGLRAMEHVDTRKLGEGVKNDQRWEQLDAERLAKNATGYGNVQWTLDEAKHDGNVHRYKVTI